MKRPTIYFYINWILLVSGIVVAILWVNEANTIGRGFISKYLAPIAFGPPILAPLFMVLDRRARSRRLDDN